MSLIQKAEWCKQQVVMHRNYAEIAKQAGISKGWVAKFATNRINNPGILYIQKLVDYFNAQLY